MEYFHAGSEWGRGDAGASLGGGGAGAAGLVGLHVDSGGGSGGGFEERGCVQR